MKYLVQSTLAATALMSSVAVYANDQPLQISGFRTGLVEFDSNRRPKIYKEGSDFRYEVNGKCIADGTEVSCQWRGFEFSYQSPDEITNFDCTTTSSRPQDYVTPRGVIDNNSQVARWGFSVKGRTGHYLRPQYTFDLTGAPLRMTHSCSNNGKEVLKWQITLTPGSK